MDKENKMGVMPIKKLVISMSLPIMISMLVQALYNIVDSIFVAKVCEDALTAVSLSFSMQNLMIGVATGTGVGVNALLSRSLGAKDFKNANKVAGQGIVLAFFSYLLFLLFGLFGTGLYFRTQVDPSTDIYRFGVDYLGIVTACSLGVFGQVIMERLAQATGKTTLSMFMQLSGAIVNIILDPLLILGIGPFPELQAKGAAVATVVGQFVAFGVGIVLNIKFNHEIKISLKNLKPDFKIIAEIYKIGIPSIVMVGIGSVMNYCFNLILLTFEATAATVFGVYFKLQSFIFMPVFGLNNGIIPIIAFNYGAKNKKRIIETVKFSCIIAFSIMLLGIFLMTVFPKQLLGFFEPTERLLEIGIPALRIISTSFIFAGICITLGSVFQALGKSYYSMMTSFTRQIVVLIPAAYLLSKTGVLDYVWLSFPIAEVASLAFTVFYFVRIYKRIISKI